MSFPLGLSGFLTVYNLVLNALTLQRRRLYVPLNLGLAVGLVGLGRARGLSWDAMGLGTRGLRLGGGLAGLAAAAVLAGSLVPRLRPLYHDRRMAGMSEAEAAYQSLFRIPLGTALPEEVVFRGVLYGAWAAERSTTAAVAGSSLVFGLWHVAPTLHALRVNRVGSTPGRRLGAVALGVAATAAAGAGLCYLRVVGGSLVAPFLVHAAANSLGAAAAFGVQGLRRPRGRPDPMEADRP